MAVRILGIHLLIDSDDFFDQFLSTLRKPPYAGAGVVVHRVMNNDSSKCVRVAARVFLSGLPMTPRLWSGLSGVPAP